MAQENAIPFELNMRMALRAQSQCRATLETLSNIKHPPVVYAKQANITTGPQQINNGTAAPRARESDSEQTQLLEASNDQRLDTGEASPTSQGDKALEAVGKVNRTKNARG